MKYKISVLIAALALVILAGTYIVGYETVTVSELENRNMFTFEMILNPVTDPESTVYGVNPTTRTPTSNIASKITIPKSTEIIML